MKKKVNIFVRTPIYTVRPPILRNVMGVYINDADIQRCLWSGAKVEEVFANGVSFPLNLSNYNKINDPALLEKQNKNTVSQPVVAPKVEEVKETTTIANDEVKIETVEEKIDPVKGRPIEARLVDENNKPIHKPTTNLNKKEKANDQTKNKTNVESNEDKEVLDSVAKKISEKVVAVSKKGAEEKDTKTKVVDEDAPEDIIEDKK